MTRIPMLLLAAFASLALAASALGSASRPAASGPSLKVQPGAAKPGGAVHVFGKASACAAGSRLTATSFPFPESMSGTGALTGKIKKNHTFSIHGHLRGNVISGTYPVTAQCAGVDLGVTVNVRVK
jgi:hypothetical protein